jgi:hypothetical protein
MAVAVAVTASVGIRVIVEVRLTVEVGAGVVEAVGNTGCIPVPAQPARKNNIMNGFNGSRMVSSLLLGSKCINTVIGVFIHNLQGIILRGAIIPLSHHMGYAVLGGDLTE